tara:strand:- start:930 stop:1142 length:213 start_codon:yes stop_codon:yes gene_type:complete
MLIYLIGSPIAGTIVGFVFLIVAIGLGNDLNSTAKYMLVIIWVLIFSLLGLYEAFRHWKLERLLKKFNES